MEQKQLLQKIKDLVSQINQECFNNQLLINFPIVLSSSTKAAGSVRATKLNMFNPSSRVVDFRISKNFDWTEESLKQVIAHELIHVYQVQILKSKMNHGHSFTNKMEEINENPEYNITIRHSMKTTKQRNVFFVASSDGSKLILMTPALQKRITPNMLTQVFGPAYKAGNICFSKLQGRIVSKKLRNYYKTTPEALHLMGIEL